MNKNMIRQCHQTVNRVKSS